MPTIKSYKGDKECECCGFGKDAKWVIPAMYGDPEMLACNSCLNDVMAG